MITERKRVENALRKSEEEYRAILESIEDGYFEVDLAGNFTFFNKSMCEISGSSPDELLGMNNMEYVSKETAKKMYQTFSEIYQTGKPAKIMGYEVIRKDGSTRIVELSASLMRDSSGQPIGFRGVARDVTERKRAEELYKILTEKSFAGIYVVQDGKFRYLNPHAAAYAGYTPEDLIGKAAFSIVHPEDAEMVKQFSKEMLKGKRTSPYEFRVLGEDGEPRWIVETVAPIYFEGEPAVLGNSMDVTGKKEADEAMRESEQRFANVVNFLPDATMIVDRDGKVIVWNQAMEEMTGVNAEEMLGKGDYEYSLPFYGERRPILIDLVFITDIDIEEKYSFVRKEKELLLAEIEVPRLRGEKRVLWGKAAPIFNTYGELVGAIESIRDITKHKRVEKKLQQAKEEAVIANLTKTEFLASMSHEIRTPMNAIVGMADLLGESPLNAEQQQYVQVFRSAGKNLLSLIDDILDISKVEAGQVNIEKIGFDLADVVEKTCEIMALRAREKGLELACHVMPDVPTYLAGDPVRLRQILVNLIGNAVKFTEKGEVFVEVKREGSELGSQGEGDVELIFSVADTGIGIPPEKVDAVFDIFTQADSSTTREYGGTGLGLTISKRLAELMDGRMWAESKVGEGSTFYFTAKFGVQSGLIRQDSPPAMDLSGLKALLVDDNPTDRMVLGQMLTTSGALVTEADNGEHGLAELRRAMEADDSYRLVLLDSRMPGMGGFSVAEHIKNDPHFVGVTIMMLTSDHRNGDIDKCRELGIGGYLIKPVRQSELQKAIIAVMGKEVTGEKPPVEIPVATDDLRPLRILLVEDSKDNRLLIKFYLKKMPWQLDIAENGEIAVEKFTSGKYDLVLMDMQMPVMDGYTATRVIRKWESQNQAETTPIIALTAHALKEDTQKSLDAGCTEHLTKPIKKAKLIETVHKYTMGD